MENIHIPLGLEGICEKLNEIYIKMVRYTTKPSSCFTHLSEEYNGEMLTTT